MSRPRKIYVHIHCIYTNRHAIPQSLEKYIYIKIEIVNFVQVYEHHVHVASVTAAMPVFLVVTVKDSGLKEAHSTFALV